MIDPIADMLTRIRNALGRYHQSVEIPYSQYKEQILGIFLQKKFIASLKVQGEIPNKKLVVGLTNQKAPISPITALQLLSKPGQRVYVNSQNIPRIKNGRGLVIISTDQGLMTGEKARRSRLGGETICYIY